MKATGIVRRIDDLGRVVIPKEIRRTLRLREGDPLEIFVGDNGEVMLKKYSTVGDIGELANDYVRSIGRKFGHLVCICDMDTVIATYNKGTWVGKNISDKLRSFLEIGKSRLLSGWNGDKLIFIVENDDGTSQSQLIIPIMVDGNAVGGVIMLSDINGEPIRTDEALAVELIVDIIGQQLEN